MSISLVQNQKVDFLYLSNARDYNTNGEERLIWQARIPVRVFTPEAKNILSVNGLHVNQASTGVRNVRFLVEEDKRSSNVLVEMGFITEARNSFVPVSASLQRSLISNSVVGMNSAQAGATGVSYRVNLLRVKDTSENGIFRTLQNNYGRQCKIELTVSGRDISRLQDTYNYPYYKHITDLNCKMENEDISLLPGQGVLGAECTFQNDQYATGFPNLGSNFPAWILMSVTFPEAITSEPLPVPQVKDNLAVNRQILSNEVACDVTIVAKNGKHIKCHKCFLFAHSVVLQTMFGSTMTEGQTGTVEILDMEEQSVRAFLAYLYYWDVENAQKNSLIAFELLNAGHKYDIASLENSMKTILLSKNNSWYDVDVAMRLFLFSRNLPEGDELKMKAIQVLKSKFSVLEQSQCYQDLFKKDPKAAMELCKYAFST